MISEAIRDDVQAQIDSFVGRARAVFDVGRYPRMASGAEFDAGLAALDREFQALQRVFHDYLMAIWSDETAAALRASAPGAIGDPNTRSGPGNTS